MVRGKEERREGRDQKRQRRKEKRNKKEGMVWRWHCYTKEVTNNNWTCFRKQKFSKVVIEDTKMVHESFHLLLFSLILKTYKTPGLGLSKKDSTRKRKMWPTQGFCLELCTAVHESTVFWSDLVCFLTRTHRVLELIFYIRILCQPFLFLIFQIFSFTQRAGKMRK